MTIVESMYPPELVFEVGHVVMSAAWVEDKAGELIQLVKSVIPGNSGDPAKGWAASGTQLVTAFRGVTNEELADRLAKALELRNHAVHGVFLKGEITQTPGVAWATMKRDHGNRTEARFELKGWSTETLKSLAEELSAIEDLIDEEIRFAMGLKERPGS